MKQKIFFIFHGKNSIEENVGYSNLINNRILIPIFNKIKLNPNANSELIEIIAKWISILDENDKQYYINLLKETDTFNEISTMLQSIENKRMKNNFNEIQKPNNRKRKFGETEKGAVYLEAKIINKKSNKLLLNKHCQIICSSQFKAINVPERRIRRHLIIFASSDLSSFHEYHALSRSNVFKCRTCFVNTAIIGYDENGNICSKWTDAEHNCSPKTEMPKNFSEIQLLKKSNYEIFENYNKHSKKTTKLLVVFDSEVKEMCHELTWNLKEFVCRICPKTQSSSTKRCTARIYNEGKCSEYLEVLNSSHTCQQTKFDVENYQLFYEHILKPNFEIQKYMNGKKEVQRLIIFDAVDKNLCYIFNFSVYSGHFSCYSCRKKGKSVTAKLCQNAEGEEYIILINKATHICQLRPLPKQTKIILRPPQFKYMENTKVGLPKLFIFENEKNKKMCYIFTKDKKSDRYFCTGCRYTRNLKEKKKNVSGYLTTDEKGIHSFQMAHQTHVCKPKEYEPDKYQCFKTADFFYFRQKNMAEKLKLAIFHPKDKSLCFIFGHQKSGEFICQKCASKNRRVSMRIKKDVNGKEYFNHIFTKHLCQPVKASTISGLNFIICENSGLLEIKEKSPKTSKTIDEAKIIKMPNFELLPNQSGEPEKRLIIYHSQNTCYQYSYQSKSKTFRCSKCSTKKQYVKAELHLDANNEKYIILGENEHVCEPLKYESKEIIKSPNFIIFNKSTLAKTKKLYTFTSSTREFFYEFVFVQNNRRFRCIQCNQLGKKVFAALITHENGEEYIRVTENHICEAKKFDPSEFEGKKIPESMFLLCPNSNGKEDRTLLVFTSDEKDFVYSYYLYHKTFLCLRCSSKNCKVTAKVFEEDNGKKGVELFGPEHVCDAQKFDPKKFEKVKLEIIHESMFKLCENTKGEANKTILVYTTENRDFAYKFRWLNGSYYKCTSCADRKKFDVAVILRINENGEKFLETKNQQHICRPQNIQEKIVIPESLFELRENINGRKNGKLIIFTSESKDMAYKYTWRNGNSYCCSTCFRMKHYRVNAKLFESENGEKYLELTSTPHACKPKIYRQINTIVPQI